MCERPEIVKLQEAKRKAQAKNRRRRIACVCQDLGALFTRNGQFEAAIEDYQEALRVLEDRNDVLGCGIAHRKIGECFLELSNWESSLEHHRAYLQLAKSIGNHTEQQRAWALIGRSYLFRHEKDQSGEALQEAQKAFIKSLEILDHKLQGSSVYKLPALELNKMRVGLYLNLGMVWNLMKDVAHSVEYIQRSLEIAEENGLFSDLHRAHYYLGCIHQADGQYPDAINRFQLAHESAGRAKLLSEQSESLTSLGEVYLMLGEFANAKVYLQKALSLVPPTQREHNTIRKHLRRAMKGIELQESLSTLPPDHHRGTMRIYEKLGDLCCKVTGYQRGLEYYQKQLACAETLKLPDEERAMIYFSLGSTYFDLKDYKQAISHYETELIFQEDHPREKCKTWLHLAAAKGMDGAGSNEVDRCYQNALQLAKESNDPRLQRKVLKEQARSHGKACSSSEQDGNDGTASDSSSQEAPETEDPELPGPSDPELQKTKKVKCSLSKRRQTRKRVEELRSPQTLKGQHAKTTVKTNQKWKRNLKGESPLHRACIKGSWQVAHSLIAMGHPLTDRDNAGWTPLHEACNNGHVEIVQMLLDSGAPVNSVDDKLCGGVTALHDALQAGHLEIAELLIDRGANLAVQDFSGRSPADCFNQWSRSIKQEASPDSRLRWESVSHILERGTPQLDTATQTAMGPELKPFSQRCQRSHGNVFVSEHAQLSSCSLSPDSTMTSCLQEQDGGHSTGAKLPQPSPTPTTQRSRKSLQSRKIQSSVGQRATTASPFSSTSDSFLSDESDDFMPFLIPFKKQHIHEGQSSASDHTYFTQSFMSTTTSSKTTQSSANTKKFSIKTTQSRKRSRKPLSKSVQSRMGSKKSSSKSVQSRMGSKKSSSKSVQSRMGSKKSSSKSVQSRMGSKKSSSKSVQSRMGSKKSSTNLVQSSVGLEESTSKHVQPSESSTLNLLVDQSQLPVVTNTAANGGQPPAVGSDWLDGNCSDDDWLEVDRSSRTQALSQPAQTVTVPVVGGSQSSSLRPGQDNAHRYSAKTAHTPTPSSLSHSGKNTMARIPSSCRVSRPSTSQPSVPSTPLLIPSFRVKVKVEKKCFVIGIPPSELDTYTISWLAEEAGRKYNIECGLRPRLSLTLDGALLSPHEPIVHLLRDNEVVLAEVVSWDLPPLSERYKTACDSLSLDANPSMVKILQLQEQGSLVDLSSLSLSKEHLSPILRALKLQTPTHQLCLSANRLGDDTMGELLACLVTMPNLRVLDLSSNQITHQGLSTLCQASRPTGEAAFQSLEELNLSLNPLGDGCSQSIASLIRSCPLLSTLKLQACGLTARFLQNFALACTMKGTKHLKTLILSNNDLGLKGVQVLLKNLPHDILSHLEISSIFCDQEAWQFLELVAGYLTQGGCVLTHLNLSRNSLTDDSISDFARYLASAASLTSLDLSENPGISSCGMERLLTALAQRDSWMEVLDVRDCSVQHFDNQSETAKWNLGELRL